MRLEQFEYLIAVAELHSMQKASLAVHTSAQNISKNIKQLENEINAVLFIRNSAGVYLTKDGEILYEHAKVIVEHINNIRNEYNLTTSFVEQLNNSTTLNILSSQYMSDMMSKIHVQMLQKYDLVESVFFIKDAYDINLMLDSKNESIKNFDILVTNVPTSDVSKYKTLQDDLKCYFLHESKIGIRISKLHYLSEKKMVSIKQLDGIPLIQITPDIGETSYIFGMVEKSGIHIQAKYKVNSVKQGIEYIKKQFGYTFTVLDLNEEEKHQAWEGTIAIPLTEKLTVTHILVVKESFLATKESKVFLEKVKKQYPNLHRI